MRPHRKVRRPKTRERCKRCEKGEVDTSVAAVHFECAYCGERVALCPWCHGEDLWSQRWCSKECQTAHEVRESLREELWPTPEWAAND